MALLLRVLPGKWAGAWMWGFTGLTQFQDTLVLNN
jgi:hypothetical protein